MSRFVKWRKQVLILMALLLIVSLAEPAYAAGSQTGGQIVRNESPQQALAEKVDPSLAKQFDESEYVQYLVKMKSQVDTTLVAKSTLEMSSMAKMTPEAKKLTTRNRVISSLRETAEQTQASLDSYLRKEQQKGSVKSFKSYYIVNAMVVMSTKKVMEEIASSPQVEQVLPDETHYLSDQPQTEAKALATNPVSKEASKETTSNVEWNVERIHAPEAWAEGIDGTGVVVANLDTGVDYTHPALKRKWRAVNASGKIENPELSWYDAVGDAPLPVDQDGQGTQTMGTMVGSEEDGSNQIGVAPGAKWIAVRIYKQGRTSDSVILDGMQWLLAPVDAKGNPHPELSPDVVNNSWSVGPGLNEFFRPVVQAWRSAGIFPEFSAGNSNRFDDGGPASINAPANYPESFATGATDIRDNWSGLSLQGPSPYGEIKPEVTAPGVNIRSSWPGGKYWSDESAGTFMAGPHTAALAALLLQANRSFTVDQLESIIIDTATSKTNAQYPESPNNGYGYGIINAGEAVRFARKGTGTVSGQVTTSGTDTEPPALDHSPVEVAYKDTDLPIKMHATDNISIRAVEVFARVKGTDDYTVIPAARTSGSYKDGFYTTTIPARLVAGEGLEYYIQVIDYGNNRKQSEVFSVKVSNGVTIGYKQDFENDDFGFTTGGLVRPWEWGAPGYGMPSAASGEKVMATNLTPPYERNSNSYLNMPPIDLTSSPQGALVKFKQWYSFEKDHDYGKIYVSAESTGNKPVLVDSFTWDSYGWKNGYIDLSSYGGQIVHVMFNFVSDNSYNYAGWYLDDIEVTDLERQAPGAPQELSGSSDKLGLVHLNWSPPEDDNVKQYIVYRSEKDKGTYEPIGTTKFLFYTDAPRVAEATYSYAVAAQGFSQNISPMSNEAALTVREPVVVYEDYFDTESDNGWTHGGTKDVWERGVPSWPGPANAPSSPNVWGTKLNGSYEGGANFYLMTPAFDLTAVERPTLVFSQWYNIRDRIMVSPEDGSVITEDSAYIEATGDGGKTWDIMEQFTNSGVDGSGMQWNTKVILLDRYAGGSVQIRFRLTSSLLTEDGDNKDRLGWYLDNFRLVNALLTRQTVNAEQTVTYDEQKNTAQHLLSQSVIADESNSTPQPQELEGKSGAMGVTGLPLGATVTVLETGRSVKADPATGEFSLRHVPGEYTLKAEAYGYYAQTEKVTIKEGSSEEVNFKLEAIPFGQVRGVITDERSGKPIAGALVTPLEDASITPVRTAADGTFTLDLLAGNYTLSVRSNDYYYKSVSVTVPESKSVNVRIPLKFFVGTSEEIAYDDGTSEGGIGPYLENTEYAVRFTPNKGMAQVTSVKLLLSNFDMTKPEVTQFGYTVYDATGDGGSPGKVLAGPYIADKTGRDIQWITVEFPEPVTVTGDFYIAYTMAADVNHSPDINIDWDGKDSKRSWLHLNGVWGLSGFNYMIRAGVRYAADAPVITAPSPDSYTNASVVNVTGTSPADDGTEVRLYNNGDLVGQGEVKNNKFSMSVTLKDGENSLEAEAVMSGNTTDHSDPVRVIVDRIAPELTVNSPTDGAITNSKAVVVSGSVSDPYFKELTVNGYVVQVQQDHSFKFGVALKEGSNTITVKATDYAGNETVITRMVEYKPSASDPVIGYPSFGMPIATPSPTPSPTPSATPSKAPSPVPVSAFNDLGSVPWAKSAIEELAAKGIVKGVRENTFAPLKKVNRAEFVTMLVRAFDLPDSGATNSFMDVKAGAWYEGAVASAVKAGIVHGTGGGKFEPNREITREEMAVIAANLLKLDHELVPVDKDAVLSQYKDKAKISAYAQESVAQLTKAGILAGGNGGLFAPKDTANRAQAAVVIQRLLQKMT